MLLLISRPTPPIPLCPPATFLHITKEVAEKTKSSIPLVLNAHFSAKTA